MSTKPCPRCGSAVPPDGRFCGQCGHTFVATTVDEATADPPPAARAPLPEPTPTPSSHVGMATMVGHAAVARPAAKLTPPAGTPTADAPGLLATVTDPSVAMRAQQMRDEAARNANAKAKEPPPAAKTLVFAAPTLPAVQAPSGDATLFDASPPVHPPPASSSSRSAAPSSSRGVAAMATMIGMPAVVAPPKSVEAPPPSSQMPSSHKTMLGVAIPGIAPTHDRPPAKPSEQSLAPASQPIHGTLVGIAAPGIAPLRPGDAEPRSNAAPVVAPPPIVPAPAPLVQEPLPEAPHRPKKKGIPAIAVVAIVFGLVLAASAIAAVVVLRSGAPLTAQPQLDESGKESLKIRCESCPDGTVIALGASSSKVEAFATVLPLPVPLKIGDNDLSMAIDRPGSGRDETVKVHVPVAYRVKADLSTLTASPPAITVRVEAGKDKQITVDGKTVTLDGSGKGAHAIDVSAEVEGPSDEQRAIDKKIPFTIKGKGSAEEAGQLVVRTGVAPLHIDAPGLELYTDRPTGNVAGQVKPGGSLAIDGQPVAVDAQGRFAIRVELPGEGEKSLTIVATSPPLAPRTVRSKVIRVGSLENAAKTLDAKSPLGFAAYGADPKSKIGQLAVVDGEIVDIRVTQGHTVIAVEEKRGCSAGPGECAVRVVHGEEVRGAARGDGIRAYGRVEGTATLSGRSIPDVEGALVLTRPAKPIKPGKK